MYLAQESLIAILKSCNMCVCLYLYIYIYVCIYIYIYMCVCVCVRECVCVCDSVFFPPAVLRLVAVLEEGHGRILMG